MEQMLAKRACPISTDHDVSLETGGEPSSCFYTRQLNSSPEVTVPSSPAFLDGEFVEIDVISLPPFSVVSGEMRWFVENIVSCDAAPSSSIPTNITRNGRSWSGNMIPRLKCVLKSALTP